MRRFPRTTSKMDLTITFVVSLVLLSGFTPGQATQEARYIRSAFTWNFWGPQSPPLNSPPTFRGATGFWPLERYAGCSWTSNGIFWMYGGRYREVRNISLYDLWSFNQTNSEWTSWTASLNYSSIQDQQPSYGAIGVFDASTWPGSRSFSTCWKMRVRRTVLGGWIESNLRDLFFLYGGVSFWNGESIPMSDLFAFDPEAQLWAYLTGSPSPDAETTAPLSNLTLTTPIRLFHNNPVYSPSRPTEDILIHATAVWKSFNASFETSELAFGNSEFTFNISKWLWESNTTAIWSCTTRCTNSAWGSGIGTPTILGRYDPSNFPPNTVQAVSWRDSAGRSWRAMGASEAANPTNSIWMKDEVGWRILQNWMSSSSHLTGLGTLDMFRIPAPRRASNFFVDVWDRPWIHSGMTGSVSSANTMTVPSLAGIFAMEPDTLSIDNLPWDNPNTSMRLYRWALVENTTNTSYNPSAYHPGRRVFTLDAFDHQTGNWFMFGGITGNKSDEMFVGALGCSGEGPSMQLSPQADLRCHNGRYLIGSQQETCISINRPVIRTSAPMPVMIQRDRCAHIRGNISVILDPQTEILLAGGNVSYLPLFEIPFRCGLVESQYADVELESISGLCIICSVCSSPGGFKLLRATAHFKSSN